jgi:hypothetical protein
MQGNGVIVLVSAALVTVAIVVAAWLFTNKPEPEPVSPVQHGKTAEAPTVEPRTIRMYDVYAVKDGKQEGTGIPIPSSPKSST